MNVEIAVFRPEHASRFAELNREWLEKYNLMKPSDEEQLAEPQVHFLANGGQIFVALHDGSVMPQPRNGRPLVCASDYDDHECAGFRARSRPCGGCFEF